MFGHKPVNMNNVIIKAHCYILYTMLIVFKLVAAWEKELLVIAFYISLQFTIGISFSKAEPSGPTPFPL